MNTADTIYEHIDAYLNGTLSETERQVFETAMQTDSSFAEEVELQKLVHTLMLEKGLSDIRKQVGKDLSVQKYFPWTRISLVVLSIVVAGIAVYLWSVTFNRNTDSVRSKPANVISPVGLDRKNETQKPNSVPHIGKEKPIAIPEARSTQDTSAFDHSSVKQEQKKTLQQQDTTTKFYQQKASPQQTTEKQTKAADTPAPCPDITFSVHTEASCRNGNTGSVQLLLSGIRGGERPYVYTIGGELKSIRTDLSAGIYAVTVEDNRGCISEKQVTVTEKNCVVFKDYSFNPNTETWKLPFTNMENGTLSIMDKSGNVVYKTDIMNGQPYEWNGRSLSGSILETGSYLYIATSADGESRQGYIILLQ